jgi:hypothetical protein
MPCCGSSRNSLGHSAALNEDAKMATGPGPVIFVYLQGSVLNVIGGATGRLYRFNGLGCRLAVDRRDAPGLSAVPMLRRL